MLWPIKTLGETCDLMTGGTPSRAKPEYFENGTIKWLVSGDIHQKEIFDCAGRITELGFQNSSAKYLPENSVMIALNGQGKTRGSVSLLRVKATCNQSLVSICPQKTDELLPEFLYINLHGRYEEIRKMTGDDGNDRRGLNMPLIRSIEIPIPPIPEQKRIVAILDQAFADIDKARANAEQNLKNARELFDSYLQQVFSQRGEAWVEETLGAIADVEYGYTDKSTEEGDLRYVRITDIDKNGELTSTSKKYIQHSKEAALFVVKDKDLLMARTGATFAKVLLYKDYEPSVFASYLIRIKFKVEMENELYWYFAKTPNYWQQAEDLKSGAAQPHFNGAALKQVLFTYPKSVEDQKILMQKFEELSIETKQLEAIYKQKIDVLDELKKSILQKAFSGELTKGDGMAA